MKKEAIRQATHEETYTVKVRKEGLFNRVKSWFGIKDAFRDETRTKTTIDETERLDAEKREILKQVKQSLRTYCQKFKSDFIDPTAKSINQQLNGLVLTKEQEYDAIKEAIFNAEEQQRKIDLLTNELIIIEASKSQLSEFKLND